ncbi:MAG TPA: hypothetical protein VFN36_03075 [Solirubrobacteraceae bacterium]|nr:hypothetical protein [Solirubrobacteraceae bacterium]
MDSCFICAKHRRISAIPGGAIISDEHCVVSHLPLVTPRGTEPRVYLGYLFVETRRHVAELGDLTAPEAGSFGRLTALASAGLRLATGAEHVYAAVIGHGAEHLHLHLIARYPHTPRDFWWTRVDEWPDAPRGNAVEVGQLADRIRAALA